MLISELMIPELAAELAVTRKLLARIPNDKLSWKPTESLHTIGWNASHLAEIVGWTSGIITESEFDISPPGAPPYVAPDTSDISALLKVFDDNTAQALASLQGVPDSVMDEPWSLKAGGHTIFTMQKGPCLRKWIFSHIAHHRGILSVYMRMAGLEFASIYEE